MPTGKSEEGKWGPLEEAVPYKARRSLTPGFMIRHFRELQKMTQNDLAKATGIPQTAISALERRRIALDLDHAKMLASALGIHPAVLAFPNRDEEKESA